MDSFNDWSPDRKPRSLEPTLLRDLLNEPIPERQWIVDELLLKGGFSLLCGKPKSGKSSLSRCLALAVARGDPFLGRKTERGPVLLLALEDHRAMLQEAFKRLGSSGVEEILVHVGAIPGNPIRQLELLIEKHQPRLVVIDTIFRFARCFDVNSYTEVLSSLTPIVDLARNKNVHVMAVHHAGKAERIDSLDSVLGSVAVHGSMDCTILVSRKGSRRTIQTQQRYGRDMEETQLGFDTSSGLCFLGQSVAEFAEQKIGDSIIAVLSRNDELTEVEIDSVVMGSTGLKRKTLRALVEDGEILRSGAGERGSPFRYCLNRDKQTSNRIESKWNRGESK